MDEDYERLFRASYAPLVRALAVTCADEQVAADAVQDAFVQALRHRRRMGSYDRPEPPVDLRFLNVTAVGTDERLFVLTPRQGFTSGSRWRFYSYNDDFTSGTVPDVESLPLGEAPDVLAAAGFEGSAYGEDPQSRDAVVRAQEPPGGQPDTPRRAPIGLRTEAPSD